MRAARRKGKRGGEERDLLHFSGKHDLLSGRRLCALILCHLSHSPTAFALASQCTAAAAAASASASPVHWAGAAFEVVGSGSRSSWSRSRSRSRSRSSACVLVSGGEQIAKRGRRVNLTTANREERREGGRERDIHAYLNPLFPQYVLATPAAPVPLSTAASLYSLRPASLAACSVMP